ncbi:phage antirepressor KilAC domain-containing protein [Acinetobacter baumannii]|uniref:Rha family transcriptional regulator n=2 Tax=Acinetobacter TaxID=469 RepID=A0A8I1HD15_ACIPI|nr:phage antirepressor KilAC domain-containing protein [Acinetobacter pittii]MBK1445780.1 Rha family transcriptional regulator [Acinetobacter pittii]WPP92355.1 Rha family transcriptional regulator [Acinetobacter pittii]
MTSQEIADLVQARHDNVKRTIETLISSGVIASPQIEEMVTTANNRQYTSQVYLFEGEQGKRDSIIIVAQLSPQFTAKLVDRWIELEQAKQQFQLPTTFSQALLLAAQLEEQREQLALQIASQQQVIEVQQVDVDALERLSNRKESMTMRDTAKLLNMRPMDLRDWMLANNWIFSPYQDCYRPTAAHSNAGHLVLSANDYRPLVRVTWKGLVLLSKKLKVSLDT